MINDKKSMAHLPADRQAEIALQHILIQVRDNPFVGWYLGHGTQSFADATEALASLRGCDVAEVRKEFSPANPRNPAEEPREGDPQPSITTKEADTLRGAVEVLETLANGDFLAAAVNREHRTYALMQSGTRKDQLALGLWCIAEKFKVKDES